MPTINLLPWRDELRARRQKDFGMLAVVVALLMAGVVAAVHLAVQSRIDHHQARNDYLLAEIAKLDKQIAEIKNLEKERARLIDRSEKIQQLQFGRPDIVHLMDELVAALPSGTHYTSIVQQQTQLTLVGKAQSNARVTALMRNLEASPWLENPRLRQITTEAVPGISDLRMSSFTLSIDQTIKRIESDEDS
ncbi:MAG: PilN domain-containing protein [Gammaproteobacteria bacterium]